MNFTAGQEVICVEASGFPEIYPHPKPVLGARYKVQYVMPVSGVPLLKLEGLPALHFPWRFSLASVVEAQNASLERLTEPFIVTEDL